MTTNAVLSSAVPVSTAYDQWQQLESIPRSMEDVERIEQVAPTRTHWLTRTTGVERRFDAEITERHPYERAAWRIDESCAT